MPSGVYKHPKQCGFQKGHKMYANFLGKPHSEKTKLKMRLAKIGKKRKPFTKEHKKNISKALKGNIKLTSKRARGKDTKNWKGGKLKCRDCGKEIGYVNKSGYCQSCKLIHYPVKSKEYHLIRSSLDFREWRESIFTRDDYTCQRCSQIGYTLHPHHIQNFSQYSALRFEIDNGITLCESCHREFHKVYGIKNNNKKQIEEFILIPPHP